MKSLVRTSFDWDLFPTDFSRTKILPSLEVGVRVRPVLCDLNKSYASARWCRVFEGVNYNDYFKRGKS